MKAERLKKRERNKLIEKGNTDNRHTDFVLGVYFYTLKSSQTEEKYHIMPSTGLYFPYYQVLEE